MKLKTFLLLLLMILLTFSAAATGKKEGGVYKIDVFTQLANYSGEQVGWLGKIIKDKFNMVLNIIPSPAGVFPTRMAAGNLGDLVVFGGEGQEFRDAIEAGMLLDWYEGDLLEKYGPDIKAQLGTALKKNADKFGNGTSCYGFGYNVAYSAKGHNAFFYHPDLRFDLYQAIGSPPIPDLMGYLDVLKKMVDYAPTGDSGLPSYGFSLFPDWDGDVVMSVKCMGAFYGYDEWGFTLYNVNDNTCKPNLDEDSFYMKGLKFFNKAYQMGILDPDSATQTFSDVASKYADGRVYYSLFSWLGPDNYNTQERMAEGKGMFAVAAENQKNICYGLSIYGRERIWSIGSKAEHPERIMELINWLTTPDGIMTSLHGPQGLTWDYDENNKPYLTDLGYQSKGDKQTEMPEEWGGGYYADGDNKINNTTIAVDEINPVSGERYNHDFWSSELARNPSVAKKKWQDAMGVLSEDEYLEKKGYVSVSVATDFVKDTRSPELEQIYKQVSEAIKEGTWKAIYAESDAEFDAIVAEMITKARELGYDECVAWDIEQGKKRAAAVRKALAGN